MVRRERRCAAWANGDARAVVVVVVVAAAANMGDGIGNGVVRCVRGFAAWRGGVRGGGAQWRRRRRPRRWIGLALDPPPILVMIGQMVKCSRRKQESEIRTRSSFDDAA